MIPLAKLMDPERGNCVVHEDCAHQPTRKGFGAPRHWFGALSPSCGGLQNGSPGARFRQAI